ncbi:glycosyltransferase [Candidatus Bathyarchaeota archaeon]|nr:glycosyltransferase [Candidatus Bathyarchaeota archaeon]
MKVSVVIPALNEEGMIEECLNSIRRQDIPVELILIDNGSIDRTPEIAGRIADKVHIKPGLTLAEMRDFGARAASGDIIVTTDADCIAPSNWISSLIKPFKDPGVVAVGGVIKPLNVNFFSNFYCWLSSIMQGVFGFFQGANMAYRKEAFLKSPGYASAKRAEDWNLSWHIRKQGKTRYVRKAVTRTEIPFDRQMEYPGGILSSILSIIGFLLNIPMLMGIGAGFVGSEMFTFLYRHKSNLRRSHMALAGIAVLYASQRFMDALSFNLSVGFLLGIFGFHVINDDLRQAIEELKLYKTRKNRDHGITGMIKLQLIKLLEI